MNEKHHFIFAISEYRNFTSISFSSLPIAFWHTFLQVDYIPIDLQLHTNLLLFALIIGIFSFIPIALLFELSDPKVP